MGAQTCSHVKGISEIIAQGIRDYNPKREPYPILENIMPIGNKNRVMAGLGSHHIALRAIDYEASIAFYTEVMGMEKAVEFIGDGRRIALLDIGDGSHLEVFEPLPDTPQPGDASDDIFFHFALATSDIAPALERVRAAGMEITTELTNADLGPLNVTIAFFKGPSGEIVELFQVNN